MEVSNLALVGVVALILAAVFGLVCDSKTTNYLAFACMLVGLACFGTAALIVLDQKPNGWSPN